MKNLNVLMGRIADRKENNAYSWALNNSDNLIELSVNKFAQIADVSLDNILSIKSFSINDKNEEAVISAFRHGENSKRVNIELYINSIFKTSRKISKYKFVNQFLLNLMSELLAHKNLMNDTKIDINTLRKNAKLLLNDNIEVVDTIYLQLR